MTKGLNGLIATFRRDLYLPDPTALMVALGTVAANYLPGNPVWAMFVGPPGCGKTELVCSMAKQDNVVVVSTLTEGGLLSGTDRQSREDNATGGVLRQLGSFGIIVIKDFGSMLSMGGDGRSSVLAAMREVYDGHWARYVGTGGGLALDWAGKIGVLAACTNSIDLDRHYQVMSTMGERFVLVRMPSLTPKGERAMAEQARRNAGSEPEIRERLAQAVSQFMGTVDLKKPKSLNKEEEDLLDNLAIFTARARSGIERDTRNNDVLLVADPEAPGRLAGIFTKLCLGLKAVGLGEPEVRDVLREVSLSCLPRVRKTLLEAVWTQEVLVPTRQLARQVQYPNSTARRALDDLALNGVVERVELKNKGEAWQLTEWAEEYLGLLWGGSVKKRERPQDVTHDWEDKDGD